MSTIMYSFIIPYYKRLKNLKYVLQNLYEIDTDNSNYEVVICSHEYSLELFQIVEKLSNKMSIKVVFTNAQWNVSQARNSAIRQANGKYLILIDADILIPSDFLKNVEKLFQIHNSNCVFVGKLYNYEENVDVNNAKLPPYSFYKQNYLGVSGVPDLPSDYRSGLEINLPWAFCWTALILVPKSIIEDNNLFFEEKFKGWGTEDLEWAYRLQQTKSKILFEKIWCIHLPHSRNVQSNYNSGKNNFNLFLKKWPCIDVELVSHLGDIRANNMYLKIVGTIKKIEDTLGYKICIAEYCKSKQIDLVIGCLMDNEEKIVNINFLNNYDFVKKYLLIGIKLPYFDKAIKNTYIVSSVFNMFSEEIQTWIKREVTRVTQNNDYVNI